MFSNNRSVKDSKRISLPKRKILLKELKYIYDAFRASYFFTNSTVKVDLRSQGIEQQITYASLYIDALRKLLVIEQEMKGKAEVVRESE